MTNEKITVFKNRNNNRNSKGGSVRLGIYKIKDKVKLNPDHDLGRHQRHHATFNYR